MPATREVSALRLEGVACARGGRVLFRGVALALPAGGAARVSGPNGAGKSSLLRIAAGLLQPLAGRIVAEGRRAWMGEDHALDPELPLARALAFWTGGDAAAGALHTLRLSPLADVPVRLLSTGQRRRAALARVAASGNPIWLLDEPANGLDAASVAILEAMVAAHRAQGGIVLVATHQPMALPDALDIRL